MAPKEMTPLEEGVENGVAWAICRAPLFGAVNGYARLPESHPWRSLDLQSSDYDKGPEIHGGITFGPDADGWIGFDYMHAGDWWPGQVGNRYEGDSARTRTEVRDEALNLVRQITSSAERAVAVSDRLHQRTAALSDHGRSFVIGHLIGSDHPAVHAALDAALTAAEQDDLKSGLHVIGAIREVAVMGA